VFSGYSCGPVLLGSSLFTVSIKSKMKSICPLSGCGKALSCKYRLKTHIERFHQNIRKYECSECFKMFKSRDNLHDHMSKHPKPLEIDMAEVRRMRAQGLISSVVIEIPKLTELVALTSDPDLRPFTVIRRIYPYPLDQGRVTLPTINRN